MQVTLPAHVLAVLIDTAAQHPISQAIIAGQAVLKQAQQAAMDQQAERDSLPPG
jgi:hypothetical protein